MLVGDGGAGKTCLLIRYAHDHYPHEYVPTVFDNYAHPECVDERPVTVGLWDTGGGVNIHYNKITAGKQLILQESLVSCLR